GNVQYYEDYADVPDTGTVNRLAAALETSAQDLMGGGRDRPPGPGPAMAHPVLETLDREECLRLIAPGGVGRVAFNDPEGPSVLPVNYVMDQGAVVFRTAAGGPMDDDLRTGLEGVDVKIGFEVDRLDEAMRQGWSVLVRGAAHHVPAERTEELAGLHLTPWAGGDRPVYIRVVPHRVSGRRIHTL
ncbi:MAG: pyridoxamine 5'-phosphate oxidase family protein, partial [Nonomuraea sp.]|nr:pyridoxamine 5'-phosphate oxidase family protein [Nonomuraea sp.]